MTKQPLVLIPGLNCTELLWEPQRRALSDIAAIQVADVRLDDSMEAMAARILAAAPERFSVAGLSMGGYVAFALHRLAPERLKRIALLDTAAYADTDKVKGMRDSQIASVEGGDFWGVVDRLWPYLVHESRLEDAALRAITRTMAEETGPQAFTRQLGALKARPDSRPALPAITAPTTIMVGEADRLTPLAAAEEMRALIPHAALHVISGCGHLSTLEKPDSVSVLLRQWLLAPAS